MSESARETSVLVPMDAAFGVWLTRLQPPRIRNAQPVEHRSADHLQLHGEAEGEGAVAGRSMTGSCRDRYVNAASTAAYTAMRWVVGSIR